MLVDHGAKIVEVLMVEDSVGKANLRDAAHADELAAGQRGVAKVHQPGDCRPILAVKLVGILEANIARGGVQILHVALQGQNAENRVQGIAELDVLRVEGVNLLQVQFSRILVERLEVVQQELFGILCNR